MKHWPESLAPNAAFTAGQPHGAFEFHIDHIELR